MKPTLNIDKRTKSQRRRRWRERRKREEQQKRLLKAVRALTVKKDAPTGTFTLTFGSVTTGAIPIKASAKQVERAIRESALAPRTASR